MFTNFEYELYELFDMHTPALRYRKICDDLEKSYNSDLKPMLEEKRKKMVTTYSKKDLEVSDEMEREFWIRQTARKAASEMVATSRLESYTVHEMMAMDDEAVVEVLKQAHKIANNMNNVISRVSVEIEVDNNAVKQ